MTLTRKHFKAIAEILNDNKASLELIKDMAYYLNTENSNFDFNKFKEASLNDAVKIADEL